MNISAISLIKKLIPAAYILGITVFIEWLATQIQCLIQARVFINDFLATAVRIGIESKYKDTTYGYDSVHQYPIYETYSKYSQPYFLSIKS